MQKIVKYRPANDSIAVSIAYHDQGAGRVICMLPSLARSGRDYDVVAAHLVAEGYRVILPDPRGFGASVGPM